MPLFKNKKAEGKRAGQNGQKKIGEFSIVPGTITRAGKTGLDFAADLGLGFGDSMDTRHARAQAANAADPRRRNSAVSIDTIQPVPAVNGDNARRGILESVPTTIVKGQAAAGPPPPVPAKVVPPPPPKS